MEFPLVLVLLIANTLVSVVTRGDMEVTTDILIYWVLQIRVMLHGNAQESRSILTIFGSIGLRIVEFD